MLSGTDKTDKLRLILLLLFCFCFGQMACAQQSREEKLKSSYEHEDKALELKKKGDLQSAIREQEKAIEINSADSKPLTVLAGMYMDLEDWQKSKEVLEKAVTIDPNDALAHHMLAGIYEKFDNKEQTLFHDKESAKLEPQNSKYLTNLGVAYGALNEKKRQRESYEKALAVDVNYLPALYNLALLEAEEKNNERAIEMLKRVIGKSSPEDRERIERARAKIKELEQSKK